MKVSALPVVNCEMNEDPVAKHYVFVLRDWSLYRGYHVISADFLSALDAFQSFLHERNISFEINDIFCYSYDEDMDLYNLIF